jgi:hypothetical protein
MFFSAKFMRKNPLELHEKLQKRYYRYPALAPSNQRINPIVPQEPTDAQITVENDKIHFSWEKGRNTKSFVIYQYKKMQRKNIEKPEHIFLTTSDNSVTYALDKRTDPRRYKYMVTAVSKSNIESSPVSFSYLK